MDEDVLASIYYCTRRATNLLLLRIYIMCAADHQLEKWVSKQRIIFHNSCRLNELIFLNLLALFGMHATLYGWKSVSD